MSKPIKQTSQAGFTLVELAIVMIIIGLLIAGVLKGQELIGNARVTSTVAQIKAIDAATSTFKDTYAALPGDMTTPPLAFLTALHLCSCVTLGMVMDKLANDSWLLLLRESHGLLPSIGRGRLANGYFSGAGSTALVLTSRQLKLMAAAFLPVLVPAAGMTSV